jgi:hypothetical protein
VVASPSPGLSVHIWTNLPGVEIVTGSASESAEVPVARRPRLRLIQGGKR